jgi:DNA modification methylase
MNRQKLPSYKNIMKIEQIPTEKLIPYARNAKKHDAAQVSKLAGSIREFGFNNPVLIDKDNGIIAGHGRVMAAQKLELKTVPCIRLGHLTDTQRRAYILADNRLAEVNSGWDEELLKLEIKDIDWGELKEISVDDFQFGEIDFGEEKEEPVSDADAEPQIDKAEELRAKWGVEPGQLWQLGNHRLLCGDSTKKEDVEKALGGALPVLMVTDPPYGVEYDANWRNEADRANGKPYGASAIGKVTNDDRADWSEAYALFLGDVAYVWHAMKTQHAVACSVLKSGFEIRAEIVWAKNALVISQGHYHPQHESCFYAVRKSATGHWAGDRKQTTLWQIDKPQKSETGHSTQKPIECMARPIRNHDSEFVYEPFSGSGTTIIACEQLGRKCRAIEISPAYVAVAIQRWADATGKTPRKL